MSLEVGHVIAKFVLDNFLFGDARHMPSDRDSLLNTGVIDSTGVLELIEFLEARFGLVVEDGETVPDNFDTIESMTAFVLRKTGGTVAETG